jgi:hypothetical protein
MGKVLMFSGLHTGLEYGKGFSFFWSAHTGPEHEKGFSFFLICTQVLNIRMVLVYSGLKKGSEHEERF